MPRVSRQGQRLASHNRRTCALSTHVTGRTTCGDRGVVIAARIASGGSMHDDMVFLSFVRLLMRARRATPPASNKPHPHRGLLRSFGADGALPKVQLSALDKEALVSGDAIVKSAPAKGGCADVTVFWVWAPPSSVWAVVSDFRLYPRWADGISESKVYHRKWEDVRVRFKRSLLGRDLTCYVRYDFQPREGFATWRLDYEHLSEVDDLVGYLCVRPVPGEENLTQVEGVEVFRLHGWLPGLSGELLTPGFAALCWIRRQAETRFIMAPAPRRQTHRVEHVREGGGDVTTRHHAG